VLYQARISLPSSVQTGTYTAETFAITKGRVVASAISRVEVKKHRIRAGCRAISPKTTGLSMACWRSLCRLLMGFIAGRLFALV
jgi:hypothetical protein